MSKEDYYDYFADVFIPGSFKDVVIGKSRQVTDKASADLVSFTKRTLG